MNHTVYMYCKKLSYSSDSAEMHDSQKYQIMVVLRDINI